LIEHRPQLRGHPRFDRFRAIHQRVHRAQQLVMRHRLRHTRYRHRLQPFEATQFRFRCAQTLEHHRAHQRFGIEAAP